MSGAASEIDHGQDECEEEEEEEEEDRDDDAEIVLEPKRNPAQISTLEVLGEDSDARRKRFESTLANNRYLEVRLLFRSLHLESSRRRRAHFRVAAETAARRATSESDQARVDPRSFETDATRPSDRFRGNVRRDVSRMGTRRVRIPKQR